MGAAGEHRRGSEGLPRHPSPRRRAQRALVPHLRPRQPRQHHRVPQPRPRERAQRAGPAAHRRVGGHQRRLAGAGRLAPRAGRPRRRVPLLPRGAALRRTSSWAWWSSRCAATRAGSSCAWAASWSAPSARPACVRARHLASAEGSVTDALDLHGWRALLGDASAHEAYLQVDAAALSPESISRFLMLDPRFPAVGGLLPGRGRVGDRGPGGGGRDGARPGAAAAGPHGPRHDRVGRAPAVGRPRGGRSARPPARPLRRPSTPRWASPASSRRTNALRSDSVPRLHAKHRTEIRYAGTVGESVNEIRLSPSDNGRQQVEWAHVRIEPARRAVRPPRRVRQRRALVPARRSARVAGGGVGGGRGHAPGRGAAAPPSGGSASPPSRTPAYLDSMAEFLAGSPHVRWTRPIGDFARRPGHRPEEGVLAWARALEGAINPPSSTRAARPRWTRPWRRWSRWAAACARTWRT